MMAPMVDSEPRGPGRIRKLGRRMSPQAQARRDQFNEKLEEFTQTDALVAASDRGDPVEVLYLAREAAAREAASLLFDRLRCVPASREAARVSSRRIAALSEVARLTLAIDRANPGEPSPDRLRRILESLRKEVEGAAQKLFGTELSDQLMSAIGPVDSGL